jgi:hypothetical protein
MAVTEEMIMAYADGELDADGCALVEAAMAEDPDIARGIEAHRRLRETLTGAFGGVLVEPAPEHLIEAVKRAPVTKTADVVELAKFRAKPESPAKRAVPRWAQWGAIAATLVVAVMVDRAWLATPAAPVAVGPGGQMAAQGELATALNDQLASDGAGKAVMIGVSFRSNQGQYCRTFQVDQGQGLAGLACREPRGWIVRMVMSSAPQVATTAYRTAASETPAPVLDAVQGLISGDPLDAKAEAAAKASGWRP